MAAQIRFALSDIGDLGVVPSGKQLLFVDLDDNTLKVKKDDQNIYSLAGGGNVDSVNSQTGVVVLTSDDIDDSADTNKFVTSSDLTKLGFITVTGAVDLDAIDSAVSAATAHIANTSNPHSVTKSQVGLGNVDNTSDENKPVSILQRSSILDSIDGDGAYYFTNVSSDLGGGRLEMIKGIPPGGGFGISNTSVSDGDILATFASVAGFPNSTVIPSGVLSFSVDASQTGGTQESRLYAEFYSRTILGVDTLLATSDLSQVLTGSVETIRGFTKMKAVSGLLSTDRLVIVIKADVSGAGTPPDITINIQGATRSNSRFPFDSVSSINGETGNITLDKTYVGLGNVDNTSDLNKPISTATQTALNLKKDLNQDIVFEPDGNVGTYIPNSLTLYVEPLQNSPDETVNTDNIQINLDSANSGFTFGTSGQAFRARTTNVSHQGTGDVGELQFYSASSNIGNGTDPIDVKGIGLSYGFGNINANVNINGPIIGYTTQISIDSSATIDSSQYIQSFSDTHNIGCATPNYRSANFAPTIASMNNNSSYTGVNLTPNITTFTGNAGFIGVNVTPTLGTFNESGYFQGINVNPNITSSRYASGLQVSMDNVTPYAGVQSSLVEQDLTFTFVAAGDNDVYTLEYTPGATAGSEVVSLVGQDITVQIEDGVSTATQIKNAVDAIPQLAAAITTTVTGTGSNPQDVFGPTNFSGGENPGRILAAYLDGDVEITGGLTFGGALSIGLLNAFGSQEVVSGSGNPATIHSLISNPTVPNNATITNGDTIGVNTAMLLNVGTNASVTSALVGLSALALPAVVQMGSGSTVDQVAGATFAVSLDPSATGGTIDNMDLCRAVALPNGITTITTMSGFRVDLPFGNPATTAWGFYESPGINNYLAGNLLVGGTPGSDDTVTNSSVALEIKSTTKSMVLSRMTTAERNAMTPVDGMVIYNTTDNKFQGRANSTWVDLH
jgi:hypothetical protein